MRIQKDTYPTSRPGGRRGVESLWIQEEAVVTLGRARFLLVQEGYGQFAEGEEDIRDFAKNGPSTLKVTGAEGRDASGKGMAGTMENLAA